MSKIKNFNKTTSTQVRWWAYAAWTLPFVALGGLGFLHLFGWETLYDRSIVVGAVAFFTISVFWWWWAIFKIKVLVDILEHVGDRFETVKEHIVAIKNDIKDKK